jgi:hypothetical protein
MVLVDTTTLAVVLLLLGAVDVVVDDGGGDVEEGRVVGRGVELGDGLVVVGGVVSGVSEVSGLVVVGVVSTVGLEVVGGSVVVAGGVLVELKGVVGVGDEFDPSVVLAVAAESIVVFCLLTTCPAWPPCCSGAMFRAWAAPSVDSATTRTFRNCDACMVASDTSLEPAIWLGEGNIALSAVQSSCRGADGKRCRVWPTGS